MFVPGKLFQSSLIFCGQGQGPTQDWNTSEVGPSLASKHWTRLESLATEKHFSLLQKSINYSLNKFYNTGPSRATCGTPLSRQAPKFQTWVEVTHTDKHSSLQQFGINYGRKKFYIPGPSRSHFLD